MLNDEDIQMINNSNIDHIDLVFDYNDLSNEFINHFDVSRLNKDYTIININYKDEASRILFFDYLTNYDESKVIETEEIKALRPVIDDIYQDMNISEDGEEYQRIFDICRYLVKNLEIDTEAVQYLQENETPNEDVEHYTKNPVSSIVEQDTEVKQAIAINYAKLFTILARKNGLDARTIYANERHDVMHPFNIIGYSPEAFYMIDAFAIDEVENSDKLFDIYDNAEEAEKYMIRKLLMPSFFRNRDYLITFNYDYPFSYQFKPLEDNIYFIESRRYQRDVKKANDIQKEAVPYELAGALFGTLVTEIGYTIAKKKKDVKKLELINNKTK